MDTPFGNFRFGLLYKFDLISWLHRCYISASQTTSDPVLHRYSCSDVLCPAKPTVRVDKSLNAPPAYAFVQRAVRLQTCPFPFSKVCFFLIPLLFSITFDCQNEKLDM